MTTFRYSPLNASFREIRLLVLHPASLDLRDSVLEMSIVPIRLGDPVTYKALLYTWGEPEPNYLVRLNRKKFKVEKNLYEALLRFRPLEGRLNFWADAVCIN
jgi:Heterokaryon incompatibility protein (HET)